VRKSDREEGEERAGGKVYKKELGRWVYKWVALRGEMRAGFGEGRGYNCE
jgi:hypothetical protein